MLYEQYQNNPYLSRQAHSFFFQTLVEIGWAGFLLLMAFIIIIFILYVYLFVKNKELRGSHFIFFIFALSILVHSLIDFDMSYIYVSCLVFFCLGAMISPFRSYLKIERWGLIGTSVWRYVYPAVVIALATFLFVFSYREYSAIRSYEHAMYMATEDKAPLQELMQPLDQAIAISPDQPEFSLRKIDWLNQGYHQTMDRAYLTKIQNAIQVLKDYEPYNRDLLLAEYRNFKDLGSLNKAIAVLKKGFPSSLGISNSMKQPCWSIRMAMMFNPESRVRHEMWNVYSNSIVRFRHEWPCWRNCRNISCRVGTSGLRHIFVKQSGRLTMNSMTSIKPFKFFNLLWMRQISGRRTLSFEKV